MTSNRVSYRAFHRYESSRRKARNSRSGKNRFLHFIFQGIEFFIEIRHTIGNAHLVRLVPLGGLDRHGDVGRGFPRGPQLAACAECLQKDLGVLPFGDLFLLFLLQNAITSLLLPVHDRMCRELTDTPEFGQGRK